ncbi:hypothetical protein HDU97_003344 [Phlyctochytrium planicorne]|nr:hypothetical protein HDU97_003344 [Phlyctochytrium planicorne]
MLVRRMMFLALIVLSLLVVPIKPAHHEQFKECHQSGFCIRQRSFARLSDKRQLDRPPYKIVSVQYSQANTPTNGRLRADVVDPSQVGVVFLLEIEFLETGPIRIRLVEKEPKVPRFELFGDMALAAEPRLTRDTVTVNDEFGVITMESKNHTVRVFKNPLVIRILKDGEEVVALNDRGYLNFEHLRSREDDPPLQDADDEAIINLNAHFDNEEEEIEFWKKNMERRKWDENFRGFKDTKPYGPSSIGLDISLPQSSFAYGLPEHSTNFSLKPTRDRNGRFLNDPYRLYNLDVFEYEINSNMSLYGSVPFVLGHGKRQLLKPTQSVGLLWLNAAEMWIDVERKDERARRPILFQGEGEEDGDSGMKFHWMTESGILDLFVFTSNSPADVTTSLFKTTGFPQFPPLFSVGYHQCRWNYNDEEDVRTVDRGFDEHDIPYDVIWLDIEHTEEKKYFTWDPVKFPKPIELQDDLGKKGRKMVTIIDPHIKRDYDYEIYKQFASQDLFVKDASGVLFEGWCWPGSSSWIDFLNPEARRPEITLPKDVKHVYGWEHRDVHNIYGALMHN